MLHRPAKLPTRFLVPHSDLIQDFAQFFFGQETALHELLFDLIQRLSTKVTETQQVFFSQ
jgi:hypothetical protein